MDAEQLGAANGNVAVPREVTVDLESEKYPQYDKCQSWQILVLVPVEVDDDGASVSNDDLLYESPQQLFASVYCSVIVKLAVVLELGQQIRGPFDRASHQLREETDIGEELHNVMGSF